MEGGRGGEGGRREREGHAQDVGPAPVAGREDGEDDDSDGLEGGPGGPPAGGREEEEEGRRAAAAAAAVGVEGLARVLEDMLLDR